MKKTIRDEYRLELYPDTRYTRASQLANHDHMRQLLADIERQVERHVDGVWQIVLKWDIREECSHCGYAWEALSEKDVANPANLIDLHSIAGEPVCCDKAIEEFRSERGIPLPGVDDVAP